MASSSAITTRVRALGSGQVGAAELWAIRRSSSSSWARSRSADLGWPPRRGAGTWRRRGAGPRGARCSASGVSDTSARSRASSAVVGEVPRAARRTTASSSRSALSRSVDLREAPLEERPWTWRKCRPGPATPRGRLPPRPGQTSTVQPPLPARLHLGLVVPLHQGGRRGHDADHGGRSSASPSGAAVLHGLAAVRKVRGPHATARPGATALVVGVVGSVVAVHAAGLGRGADHLGPHRGAQRVDAAVHGRGRGRSCRRPPAAAAALRASLLGLGGRGRRRRGRRRRPRRLVARRRGPRRRRRRRCYGLAFTFDAAPPQRACRPCRGRRPAHRGDRSCWRRSPRRRR